MCMGGTSAYAGSTKAGEYLFFYLLGRERNLNANRGVYCNRPDEKKRLGGVRMCGLPG